MKWLLVVVIGGVLLLGGVVAYRHGKLVEQAWQELEKADREVVETEQQFLTESLRILGQEQEFRDSIDQFRQFNGGITERQERFVWLSGNCMSQLVARGEPDSSIKQLQAYLNRRSVLVRRFDKRAEEYRAGCSDGMRVTVARWLGACSHSLGQPVTPFMAAPSNSLIK